MRCIRIFRTPRGEAPESIRAKWIGRILPAGEETDTVGSGVLSGLPRRVRGFRTSALLSIEILNLYEPEAARWWREETQVIERGGELIFDEACCVLEDSFPSLASAAYEGRPSVAEFLNELGESAQFWASHADPGLDESDWEKLRSAPLSRASGLIVLWLMVSGVQSGLAMTVSADMFQQHKKEAGKALGQFYRTARAMDLEIAPEEILRFLTPIDQLIRAGLLERDLDGNLGLTQKGKGVVEAIQRRMNAQNN